MVGSIGMLDERQALAAVLDHWGLASAEARPIGTGLINRTFEVVDHGAILQQVNAVFDPGIHHNIVAVTEHLARKGVATPQLLPTRAGAAWVEHEGRVWRLQTRVEGYSVDAVTDLGQVRAAGEFVGRWHACLDDLDHEFVALRAGVHATALHLARLREAVDQHGSHRLFAALEPLATALLGAAEALEPMPTTSDRVAHGDLKISNLMFAGDQPVALVDLDTVAPMALGFELGDAWRSWCNPAREDEPEPRFDVELFAASLAGWERGYGQPLAVEQRRALVLGPEWISLELACRFAADALEERYFGWNPDEFPGRGEHNLARARGQWALHRAMLTTRASRELLLRAP